MGINSNNNTPKNFHSVTLGDAFIGNSSLEGASSGSEFSKHFLSHLPMGEVALRFLTLAELQTENTVLQLKPSESCFLTLKLEVDSSGGHAILFFIEKKQDNTLSISVINTGFGIEKYHPLYLKNKGEGTELSAQCFVTYTNIDPETFISNLPRLNQGIKNNEDTLKPVDFLYTSFFEELTHTKEAPYDPLVHPEFYQKPPKSGTCVGKSLFAALRFFCLKNSPNPEEALLKYKKLKIDSRFNILDNLLAEPSLSYREVLFGRDVYRKMARAIEKQKANPFVDIESYQKILNTCKEKLDILEKTFLEEKVCKIEAPLLSPLNEPFLHSTPPKASTPISWNEQFFPPSLASSVNISSPPLKTPKDLCNQILKIFGKKEIPEGENPLLIALKENEDCKVENVFSSFSSVENTVNLKNYNKEEMIDLIRQLPSINDPFWSNCSKKESKDFILILSFLSFLTVKNEYDHGSPSSIKNQLILSLLFQKVYPSFKKIPLNSLVLPTHLCLNAKDLPICDEIMLFHEKTHLSQDPSNKSDALFRSLFENEDTIKKYAKKIPQDPWEEPLFPFDIACFQSVFLNSTMPHFSKQSITQTRFPCSSLDNVEYISHNNYDYSFSKKWAVEVTGEPVLSLSKSNKKNDVLVRAISEKKEKPPSWISDKNEFKEFLSMLLSPGVLSLQLKQDPEVLITALDFLQHLHQQASLLDNSLDNTVVKCSLLYAICYIQNTIKAYPKTTLLSSESQKKIEDLSSFNTLKKYLNSQDGTEILVGAHYILLLPPPSVENKEALLADYAFALSCTKTFKFFQFKEMNIFYTPVKFLRNQFSFEENKFVSNYKELEPEYLIADATDLSTKEFFKLFDTCDKEKFTKYFLNRLKIDEKTVSTEITERSITLSINGCTLTKITPEISNFLELDTLTYPLVGALVPLPSDLVTEEVKQIEQDLQNFLKIHFSTDYSLKNFTYNLGSKKGSFIGFSEKDPTKEIFFEFYYKAEETSGKQQIDIFNHQDKNSYKVLLSYHEIEEIYADEFIEGTLQSMRQQKNRKGDWEKTLFIKGNYYQEGNILFTPPFQKDPSPLSEFTYVGKEVSSADTCAQTFVNGSLTFNLKQKGSLTSFESVEFQGFSVIKAPSWNPLFSNTAYEVKNATELNYECLHLYNKETNEFLSLFIKGKTYFIIDIDFIEGASFHLKPRDPEILPDLIQSCLEQNLYEQLPSLIHQLTIIPHFSSDMEKRLSFILESDRKQHPKAVACRLKIFHALLSHSIFYKFNTLNSFTKEIKEDLASYLKNKSNFLPPFKLSKKEEKFILDSFLQVAHVTASTDEDSLLMHLASSRQHFLENNLSIKTSRNISSSTIASILAPKASTEILEIFTDKEPLEENYLKTYSEFDFIRAFKTSAKFIYNDLKNPSIQKDSEKLEKTFIRLEKITSNQEFIFLSRILRAGLKNPSSLPEIEDFSSNESKNPSDSKRLSAEQMVAKTNSRFVKDPLEQRKETFIHQLKKLVTNSSGPTIEPFREQVIDTSQLKTKNITRLVPTHPGLSVEKASTLNQRTQDLFMLDHLALKEPFSPSIFSSEKDFLEWVHSFEDISSLEMHGGTFHHLNFSDLMKIFLLPNWKELLKEKTKLPDNELEKAEKEFFQLLLHTPIQGERSWNLSNPLGKLFAVFEYQHALRLKPVQSKVALDLFHTLKNSQENSDRCLEGIQEILLFSTGTGKSSVLAPLFEWLHSKKQTVFNVWPKSLFLENATKITENLYQLGQEGIFFNFTRQNPLDKINLLLLMKAFQTAKKEKMSIHTTAQSLQALQLQFIQELASLKSDMETLSYLQSILIFFTNSALHIDEVHVILSPFTELNFDMGARKEAPEDHILLLSDTLLKIHSHINLLDGKHYQFTELERVQAVHDSLTEIASERGYLPFLAFILGEENSPPEGISPEDFERICLLRGLNLSLVDTLSKTPNLHYGKKESEYAIPYQGVDTPIKGSEFSNLHEAINKTFLIYLNDGLSEKNKEDIFSFLKEKTLNEATSTTELMNSKSYKMLVNFFEVPEGFSILDLKKAPPLKESRKLESTLFFVTHFIAHKITANQEILRSTSSNLSSMFHGRRAMSATPSSPSVYSVETLYDPSKTETSDDTKVIRGVIASKFNSGKSVFLTQKELSLSNLIEQAVHLKNCRMLIDGGALLKGSPALTVAKKFFELLPENSPIKGFVYYEGDVKWILEKGKKDPSLMPKTSPFTTDELFTFCDQSHSFGTDTKQNKEAVGVVTVDVSVDTKQLLQHIGRLRQFTGGDQQVAIVMDEKTKQRILNEETESELSIEKLLAFTDQNLQIFEQKEVLQAFKQQLLDSVRKEALEIILKAKPEEMQKKFLSFKDLFISQTPSTPSALYASSQEKSSGRKELEAIYLDLKQKCEALSLPLTSLNKTHAFIKAHLEKDPDAVPKETIIQKNLHLNQNVEVSVNVNTNVSLEVNTNVSTNTLQLVDRYDPSVAHKWDEATDIFQSILVPASENTFQATLITSNDSSKVTSVAEEALKKPILSKAISSLSFSATQLSSKVPSFLQAIFNIFKNSLESFIFKNSLESFSSIFFRQKVPLFNPLILTSEQVFNFFSKDKTLSLNSLFPSNETPLYFTSNFLNIFHSEINNGQTSKKDIFSSHSSIPQEMILIKENGQWSILIGNQEIDVAFFKKKLQENPPSSENKRKVLTYELNVGITGGRTSNSETEEIANNKELQKAFIRLKLYRHDPYFSEKEKELLKEILKENLPEWKHFFDKTKNLRTNDALNKQFEIFIEGFLKN